MKPNIILDKSFNFALRIVELYKHLSADKHEYVLSKQLLRSGTSIGANLREANLSISRKEFIAKVQISLKEASETEYWLMLLKEGGYIGDADAIINELTEIIKILTKILKTTKDNLNEAEPPYF